MRDESYFEFVDVSRTVRSRGRWAAVAGAVASVAALAIIVVWTYRLGMRDAQSVPVIRAVEGPAKIRPDDPGGARFDHQGRAVYDALREAPAAPAAIALAPPAEALAEEDRSPAEIAASIEAAAALQEAEEAAALARADFAADALAAQIDAMVSDVVASDAAPFQVALIDPTASAPVRSPVARPRPGSPSAAVVAALQPAPSAAGSPAEALPDTLPVIAVTGPQIQLGAYLSEEMALSMWSAIARRNGDLFAGRDPVLGAVRQGGQDLVLLRVGPFESDAQALDLCQRMRARDEDCLTVSAR